MKLKKGTHVFIICNRRLISYTGENYARIEVVREGSIAEWHGNISDVDFGGVIGVKCVYNEDIFTSEKDALNELRDRLLDNLDRIERKLATLN